MHIKRHFDILFTKKLREGVKQTRLQFFDVFRARVSVLVFCVCWGFFIYFIHCRAFGVRLPLFTMLRFYLYRNEQEKEKKWKEKLYFSLFLESDFQKRFRAVAWSIKDTDLNGAQMSSCIYAFKFKNINWALKTRWTSSQYTFKSIVPTDPEWIIIIIVHVIPYNLMDIRRFETRHCWKCIHIS